MERMKFICFGLMFALLVGSRAGAVRTRSYSVPDLVAGAAIIARGPITVDAGEPFLVVSKLLKGDGSDRIMLGWRGFGLGPPARFEEGEAVILFLEPPDETGRAYLIGYSDQGKWPQPHRRDGWGSADIPALERAIGALNEALAGRDFETRAKSIVAMLRSHDEILQLAGLGLAESETLSKWLPQKQRATARCQLAAHALGLVTSENPNIRGGAIRLLKFAPNVVAAPALIPLITDPDAHCRRHARVSLGRVVADAKIDDPDILEWLKWSATHKSEYPDPYDIQIEFAVAWQSKRELRLAKEVPRLRSSLDATSDIERESASIYLRYLGISAD